MSENAQIEYEQEKQQVRNDKQDFLDHLQEEIQEVFHLMGDHFSDQYDMLTIEEYMELCGNRINRAVNKMKQTARRVIEVPMDRIV